MKTYLIYFNLSLLFSFLCQISVTSTRIFDAQKKIAIIQLQTLVWVHTIVQK